MDHTTSPLEESAAVIVAGKPKRIHCSTVEVVNLHGDFLQLPGNQERASIDYLLPCHSSRNMPKCS
ncbi:MAG: hypothetical protein JXR84_19515, partial [Anaerolineae bacterium]|nr:hypothetical protein [Anaerolineae bacterium]